MGRGDPRCYSHQKSLMTKNILGENTSEISLQRKAIEQLVLLSFDITAFTPVAYQRNSLLRLLREISS